MAEGHVAASRGLIKRGPLEKGMANHFSILSGEPHDSMKRLLDYIPIKF